MLAAAFQAAQASFGAASPGGAVATLDDFSCVRVVSVNQFAHLEQTLDFMQSG